MCSHILVAHRYTVGFGIVAGAADNTVVVVVAAAAAVDIDIGEADFAGKVLCIPDYSSRCNSHLPGHFRRIAPWPVNE